MLLLLLACSENKLYHTPDEGGGDTTAGAPDIAVDPAAIDFGTVASGDSGAMNLTIANQGDETLNLADLSLATESYAITWTDVSSPIVAPGAAVETVVTWSPDSSGAMHDTLVITSDDPDEPEVDVPLSGNSPAGDISVTPATWDFGTLEVGASATTTVNVANVGDGPLVISDWSYSANDADLSVIDPGALAAMPTTLGPGESTDVVVQYAPSAGGPDEGTLSITSDDADTPNTGAAQFGAGEEPDPCDGFTQTVDLLLTADDEWEGWIDNVSFTGPNASAWNAFDQFEWEMPCGDHALSLHARDTAMVISGVIAVVKVEGVIRFVSGPSDWTMTDSAPPAGWTDPGFDDSSWHIPEVCSDTSPWGSVPQTFYDQGASWIWWTSECTDLGEAWLRLNFTVP
jgi:hypothetical protein